MPDPSDDKTLSQDAVQVFFSSIGPYRLIQMLGVGGMGEVWRAEQTEPIHRTVALKLIKAGMDTKSVVARFDLERQALALMEHPNIAKVFDAGATPEGRPYFVMEYVHGRAITDYCDSRKHPGGGVEQVSSGADDSKRARADSPQEESRLCYLDRTKESAASEGFGAYKQSSCSWPENTRGT